MGQEDLRQHPRLVAPQADRLLEPGAEAGAAGTPCMVEDLSAGGARVLAAQRFEPGQQVGLHLPGGPVWAGTFVYRFEDEPCGYGYGLRFATAAQGAVADAWQAVGTSQRLLVVHPDRSTCRLLVRDLTAAGALAAAVQTACDAVSLLDFLAPSLRAVLLEAGVAEAGEPDLLSLLAERHPQLGRVLLHDPMYPCMSIRRRPAPMCEIWSPPYGGPRLRRWVEELEGPL